MSSLKFRPCIGLFTLLVAVSIRAEEARPLRALLVCGGCCHDYGEQKGILRRGIEGRARVVVDTLQQGGTARESAIPLYDDPEWARGYDVVIHDECFGMMTDTNRIARILAPHRAGLPAVNLHCAAHSYRMAPGEDWPRFLGIRSLRHGPAAPIEVRTVDATHPVIAGLVWRTWRTGDEELYNNVRVYETATPLQRGVQGTDDQVVTWVNRFGSARVFNTTLGHFNATVSDPRYLDLVVRGLLWACDRLDEAHLQPLVPEPAPGK
jgi:type 1 glutamine amidotransferase